MIPGLPAVMAEAPGLLEGYGLVHELFANSSFDKDELTVVWQTVNVEHARRHETPLPNARLEALSWAPSCCWGHDEVLRALHDPVREPDCPKPVALAETVCHRRTGR